MHKPIFVLLAGILQLVSCDNRRDQLTHIKNPETKLFLELMFEKNGGLENWQAIKELKYKKSYELYTESGKVEKFATQIHNYKFSPKVSIHIVSQEEEDVKEIMFENELITEYVNDTINNDADQETLTNNMQSSVFVISQPFKLSDKGPTLNYEGLDTLSTGEEVHVLRAVYNASAHDNLTTSDTWWVYFDKDSYIMTGYMVKHLDHYSLIRNLETIEVEGFHFPLRRKSWRVTENGDILYLRASYDFSDFEIK